jgi:hypothetical protein
MARFPALVIPKVFGLEAATPEILRASDRMNSSMSLRGAQRRSNLNPTDGDRFAALQSRNIWFL